MPYGHRYGTETRDHCRDARVQELPRIALSAVAALAPGVVCPMPCMQLCCCVATFTPASACMRRFSALRLIYDFYQLLTRIGPPPSMISRTSIPISRVLISMRSCVTFGVTDDVSLLVPHGGSFSHQTGPTIGLCSRSSWSDRIEHHSTASEDDSRLSMVPQDLKVLRIRLSIHHRLGKPAPQSQTLRLAIFRSQAPRQAFANIHVICGVMLSNSNFQMNRGEQGERA